jgi:hypothetical protein
MWLYLRLEGIVMGVDDDDVGVDGVVSGVGDRDVVSNRIMLERWATWALMVVGRR